MCNCAQRRQAIRTIASATIAGDTTAIKEQVDVIAKSVVVDARSAADGFRAKVAAARARLGRR